MANVRTVNDGYQYRIHQILNKINDQIKGNGFQGKIEDYLNTRNGKLDLAEALLEDIEEYCGIEDALENER